MRHAPFSRRLQDLKDRVSDWINGRGDAVAGSRASGLEAPALAAEAPSPAVEQLIRLIRHLDAQRSDPFPPVDQAFEFNLKNRNAWVASVAEHVPAGALVLDVGAGACPYRPLFAHATYESHDFKQYEGFLDSGRGEGLYGQLDYVSDITALPVPDGRFDLVLCTEVLEHVPEPILAVGEMTRVLKSGGTLALTAPLGAGLHQEPYHYYGGYTPHWYTYVAERFGLEVDETTPNRGSFSHIAQECCRVSWWIERHRHLHGEHAAAVDDLFGALLPKLLTRIDEAVPDRQFAVGFHVRLTKQ